MVARSETAGEPEKISMAILGDGGTGKSCITMRLVRSQWVDVYDPTIEDSYTTTRVIDGQKFELEIIDTAGQDEYRGLLSGLWQSGNVADAYLLVYDVTAPDSLLALEEFDDLISNAQEINHSPHAAPPVKMVAGNKCDLVQHRAISSAQGLTWARKHGCGFMETSALMTVNIEETFALTIRRIMENRRLERRALEEERHAREELAAEAAAAVGIPTNPYANNEHRPILSPTATATTTTARTTQSSTSSTSERQEERSRSGDMDYYEKHAAYIQHNIVERTPEDRTRISEKEKSATCCVIV
ncbi:P-loop containing nucleoside triphosphate hydrolase protein [Lipomyces kononenkoae]|uniref:P-loop containing nucleoside triphosphate hydrolase protein n=1 Tax=Lipomyces kononenkoae TaxID=34357 RepID=A0ACC3T997_LIPKO